jgi:hypothetical protein
VQAVAGLLFCSPPMNPDSAAPGEPVPAVPRPLDDELQAAALSASAATASAGIRRIQRLELMGSARELLMCFMGRGESSCEMGVIMRDSLPDDAIRNSW